jgi:DNA-binding Lrp family transcriptional regulator
MDPKDFQLLIALHQNARQSYRSLGRQVSLSAPAVRERLKNLERRGILQGYMLSVDPSLLERNELLVFFRGDFTREDAEKALSVPDVGWVAWKVDGGLTVQVWSKSRTEPIKKLTLALGAKPRGTALSKPRSHRPLSSLDWRIIDALVDNPRMSFEKLIDVTGLSAKTVRKHLKLMLQTEAIFITPRPGALADSGELVYTLAVFGRVGMSEVKEILGDAFMINETQEPPAKYMLCLGSDLGDVTTKTHALQNLPDVDFIEVTLIREMLLAREFLHSLVREQIQIREKIRR